MPEQENIDLVKRLYEAFGKGDIDTIIDHLASQFAWRFDAPSTIPSPETLRPQTKFAVGSSDP